MFQYNELLIGEKDCILTTLEIATKFISEKTIEEEKQKELNEM